MDFFQRAPEDYLGADPASFNNPEFYLHRSEVYEAGKSNWYVDVLSVNFREKAAYLCEVTYARNPKALHDRLVAWKENWTLVVAAIQRDAGVPSDWKIRVWVFCPEERLNQVLPVIPTFDPIARVTNLEMILPWKYSERRRIGEDLESKSKKIPIEMRV